MEGHTTELIPKQKTLLLAAPQKKTKKKRFMSFEEAEHLLILVVLLSFSINVALVFIKLSPSDTKSIVDDIPQKHMEASAVTTKATVDAAGVLKFVHSQVEYFDDVLGTII